jgi:hypothetical protein
MHNHSFLCDMVAVLLSMINISFVCQKDGGTKFIYRFSNTQVVAQLPLGEVFEHHLHNWTIGFLATSHTSTVPNTHHTTLNITTETT